MPTAPHTSFRAFVAENISDPHLKECAMAIVLHLGKIIPPHADPISIKITVSEFPTATARPVTWRTMCRCLIETDIGGKKMETDNTFFVNQDGKFGIMNLPSDISIAQAAEYLWNELLK